MNSIQRRSSKRRTRNSSPIKKLISLMGQSAREYFISNQDDIDINNIRPAEKGSHAGKVTVKELKKAMKS